MAERLTGTAHTEHCYCWTNSCGEIACCQCGMQMPAAQTPVPPPPHPALAALYNLVDALQRNQIRSKGNAHVRWDDIAPQLHAAIACLVAHGAAGKYMV